MDCSKKLYLTLILFLFAAMPAKAGFLDMPEITESLELEKKSMLRDLDIPGVKERNPDPSAGPRLAVREFRVQGLVEYPELGITKKAINRLVEAIRYDLMQEDKLLDSGYSLEELSGLSDLLVEIEEQTEDRHVTPLEVQKLVWLIRDQRTKRGITLGQIEAIADRITRFYRERGFILAKAYIPKQEVRDGIVTLTLLLGMLGSVEVNNNKMYAKSNLVSVFDNQLAKPVTSWNIEESLYLINDYPGISVNGFFEPGYQVGDTKLNINVKNEERFNSNIRLDNHGTKNTGLYRVYADTQVNNPFGISDLINASILYSTEPDNTFYYRLYYQANLFSPRWKVIAGISENQFLIDQTTLGVNLNLNGTVNVTDIGIRYDINRSRKNNSRIELKTESIISDLKIGDVDTKNFDEELQGFSFSYHFDTLNEKARNLHQGMFKVKSTDIKFGADDDQDKQYQVYIFDYTLLSFVKVPFTDTISRLVLRSNLQYAGKKISAIGRSALAGPTRVRAYSSDLFSADDSILVGADWIFNAPDFFGDLKPHAKPFVFADISSGKQYSITTNESDVTGTLADAGVGIQFAYKGKFNCNLQVAFPIYGKFSDPDIKIAEKDVRIVFDMQYKF